MSKLGSSRNTLSMKLTQKNLEICRETVAVIAAARTVCAENEYPTSIPEAIRMCYEDKFISNRYNRLPHSMDNLISIIRKIEAHPDTEYWPMAKMTGTILRR